jgi:DNA-binding transcriptional LysR family regulator
MELRHLRYFVAVADAQNMGRAAQRLRVAQSALSRQIQDLEREVGTPLLARLSRGIRLTTAGDAFLVHARQTLAAAERAVAAARAAAEGEEGTLRVAPPDAGDRIRVFAAAVERFRAVRPGIAVQLVALPWMEHAAAVRAGRVDVGYTYGTPSDFPADIVAEHLEDEPVTAAMLPAAHPLAHAATLTLAELAPVPFVLSDRAAIGGLHDVVMDAMRRGGHEPRVISGMTTFAGLVQLVAGGAGWALVAASVADAPPPGTVVRPIRDADPSAVLGVYAVRRREPSAAADAFVEALRAVTAGRSSAE